MLVFLKENIATIIISLVILAIVICIISKMVKDKRQGKGSSSCGCGCENCPSSGMCHK